MKGFYLIFSILLIHSPIFGSSLSTADFDTAYGLLEDFFSSNPQHLPTAVRLTFHDCVGGCDGCINFDNADNAGLEDIVADLEVQYDSDTISSTGMSRADFWTIASYVAIAETLEIANRQADTGNTCRRRSNGYPYCFYSLPNFYDAQFGRVDCNSDDPTGTDAMHEFPSPNGDSAATTAYFADEFGLTAEETVAIMGAHTLGAADPNDSGYAGAWIAGGQDSLNSAFYDDMEDATITWDNREIGRNTGKWQFTGTEDGANRAFMLNSDFGLLYDLELNADGEAQCSVEQGSANMCSDAPTASAMRAYQGNTAAWVADFYTALKKLQSAGSATLTSLDA